MSATLSRTVYSSAKSRHSTVRRQRLCCILFFFSSRRRHTRFKCDWSSDVCSSDLLPAERVTDGVGGDREARAADVLLGQVGQDRSEERRVGKECRSRGQGEQ